jgi:hypothetical protein
MLRAMKPPRFDTATGLALLLAVAATAHACRRSPSEQTGNANEPQAARRAGMRFRLPGARFGYTPAHSGDHFRLPGAHFGYTVTRSEFVSAIGSETPPAGSRYLVVRLTRRNDDADARSATDERDELLLRDSSGHTYEPAPGPSDAVRAAEHPQDAPRDGAGRVLPGGEEARAVVFVVPEDALSGRLDLQIRVETSAVDGGVGEPHAHLEARVLLVPATGAAVVTPPAAH